MGYPNLTFSLSYPNVGQTKLSYNAPFNTINVTLSSDTNLNYILVCATKEGQDYGPGMGTYIIDSSSIAKNTNFSFTINANNHLKGGAGVYRVGMYAQSTDLIWNWEYFFITSDGQYFTVSNGDYLIVPEIGYLVRTQTKLNNVVSATNNVNFNYRIVRSGESIVIMHNGDLPGYPFYQWYDETNGRVLGTTSAITFTVPSDNTLISAKFNT